LDNFLDKLSRFDTPEASIIDRELLARLAIRVPTGVLDNSIENSH